MAKLVLIRQVQQRFYSGAFGFLTLIQVFDGPERLSIGTAIEDRAPPSLADGLVSGSSARSRMLIIVFESQSWPNSLSGLGGNEPCLLRKSAYAGGTSRNAAG
jgi:hypothetical protein